MKKIIAFISAALFLLFLMDTSLAQSGYWAECLNTSTGQRYQCFIPTGQAQQQTVYAARVTVAQVQTPTYVYPSQTQAYQYVQQGPSCPNQAAVVYQPQPYPNYGQYPQYSPYQPQAQLYQYPEQSQVYYPSSGYYPTTNQGAYTSGSRTVTEQIRIDRGYGSGYGSNGYGKWIPRVRYDKKIVTKRSW